MNLMSLMNLFPSLYICERVAWRIGIRHFFTPHIKELATRFMGFIRFIEL